MALEPSALTAERAQRANSKAAKPQWAMHSVVNWPRLRMNYGKCKHACVLVCAPVRVCVHVRSCVRVILCVCVCDCVRARVRTRLCVRVV
jgi:hypothetical protein